MTLPESETVDHPRKREETTQKTAITQLNYLAASSTIKGNLTTPQYN